MVGLQERQSSALSQGHQTAAASCMGRWNLKGIRCPSDIVTNGGTRERYTTFRTTAAALCSMAVHIH